MVYKCLRAVDGPIQIRNWIAVMIELSNSESGMLAWLGLQTGLSHPCGNPNPDIPSTAWSLTDRTLRNLPASALVTAAEPASKLEL